MTFEKDFYYPMKNNVFPLLSFFAFLIIAIPQVSAQGDLMVLPKRLVFDGSNRSQEIHLANTGQDSAIYALSFINYRMTEYGAFEQVESPQEGQRFATDFLRYFPRRVSLGPSEAQTIRVQLNRIVDLEQGEYRSHMYFRAVEKQEALGLEDEQASDGISINIKTVFGISIPIIIRHGDSTTEVSLSNSSLDLIGEFPKITMTLNRSGNMSVYGDLKIQYESHTGNTIDLELIKGIAVYTPNSTRIFSVELHNHSGVNFKEGKLKITYTSESGEELAMTEINLK